MIRDDLPNGYWCIVHILSYPGRSLDLQVYPMSCTQDSNLGFGR